ncbi:MAG: 6-phosphogluconolactonase [Wenzhouxiangellaceae bacterium]|nr:6-phosphogluconolactonase [Wenzhouxiangellaceae bacterium]
MPAHQNEHSDFEALVETVAGRLHDACERALEERGAAALALAGGSTPMPVYARLARSKLDWPRVTLLPGDERWVAHGDPACNLTAIRAAFGEVPARFESLTPANAGGEPDPATALNTARTALARIGRPFDACLLGMGGDGHFASLFPGAPELATALDPASAEPLAVVRPDPLPPEAPYARISLTLSAIAAGRELLLVIRGDDKRQALERAMQSSDPNQYPIAALLEHAGDRLEIHWSP